MKSSNLMNHIVHTVSFYQCLVNVLVFTNKGVQLMHI